VFSNPDEHRIKLFGYFTKLEFRPLNGRVVAEMKKEVGKIHE